MLDCTSIASQVQAQEEMGETIENVASIFLR